jgi:hypothetical protein
MGRPKATCFGLRQRAKTREAREPVVFKGLPPPIPPVAESPSQDWGAEGTPSGVIHIVRAEHAQWSSDHRPAARKPDNTPLAFNEAPFLDQHDQR